MGPRSSALKWEARCISFQIRRVPVRFREDAWARLWAKVGVQLAFWPKR